MLLYLYEFTADGAVYDVWGTTPPTTNDYPGLDVDSITIVDEKEVSDPAPISGYGIDNNITKQVVIKDRHKKPIKILSYNNKDELLLYVLYIYKYVRYFGTVLVYEKFYDKDDVLQYTITHKYERKREHRAYYYYETITKENA